MSGAPIIAVTRGQLSRITGNSFLVKESKASGEIQTHSATDAPIQFDVIYIYKIPTINENAEGKPCPLNINIMINRIYFPHIFVIKSLKWNNSEFLRT